MTDFNDVLFKRTDSPAERPVPEAVAAPTEAEPYALRALEAEVGNVSAAPPGTRNHTLNVAAFNLGQLVGGGYLDAETVKAHLTAAALTAGLDPSEIHATIRSGLTGGMESPRAVEPPQSQTAPAFVLSMPDTPDSTQPQWTPEMLAQLQADVFEQRVTAEMNAQRLRREARKRLDAAEVTAAFREPGYRNTLTADLSYFATLPPLEYAIEAMLPTGGNALLTAAFKTGKTTVVNDLARAFADRRPFLSRFEVDAPEGTTIALFNYEVDERQYLRWLSEAGIQHTDRVVVLNLRGFRLPLTVPHIEDWVVAWLTAHRVGMWVVDPFARAFTGCGDENDNSAVGTFLDTLDVIKERAGVRDLILTAHTGRAEMGEGRERARGATRLDDWPDVRWILTQDDGARYLSATGRDVDVEEETLTLNGRELTLAGGDRKAAKRKIALLAACEIVEANPLILKGKVVEELRDRGVARDAAAKAVADALARHLLTSTAGPGNSQVLSLARTDFRSAI